MAVSVTRGAFATGAVAVGDGTGAVWFSLDSRYQRTAKSITRYIQSDSVRSFGSGRCFDFCDYRCFSSFF